jgi:hypothetical protein
MATGPEVVRRYSEDTGIAHGTVDRFARVLKQHVPPMFARSVQGNGAQSEHASTAHLVNLTLALPADSISNAVSAVVELRSLVPVSSGESEPFLPGYNLGEVLESYVSGLSNGRFFEIRHISLKITKIFNRRANVLLSGFLEKSGIATEVNCFYLSPEYESFLTNTLLDVPAAAPLVTYTINWAMLKMAADLWADTQRHYQQTSNETAAPRPGSAAAINDQPETTEPDQLSQADHKRGERISQPLATSRSGASRNRPRSINHGGLHRVPAAPR